MRQIGSFDNNKNKKKYRIQADNPSHVSCYPVVTESFEFVCTINPYKLKFPLLIFPIKSDL